MTVREILMLPYERYEQSVAKLKGFLEHRTQRERFWIVVVMFLLFFGMALWQLFDGLSTESTIDHIQFIK